MSGTLEDLKNGTNEFASKSLDLVLQHSKKLDELKAAQLAFELTFPVDVLVEYYLLGQADLEIMQALTENGWYLLEVIYRHHESHKVEISMGLVTTPAEPRATGLKQYTIMQEQLNGTGTGLKIRGLISSVHGGTWGRTHESYDYTVYGLSELGKYLVSGAS